MSGREKSRAAVVAVLLVLSVAVTGVAVTGTAAADEGSEEGGDDGEVGEEGEDEDDEDDEREEGDEEEDDEENDGEEGNEGDEEDDEGEEEDREERDDEGEDDDEREEEDEEEDEGEDEEDDEDDVAAPDINVTKSVDRSDVQLDLFLTSEGALVNFTPVTFTVNVTNEGDATANNVVVNDDDVVADLQGLPNNTTSFVVTESNTSQGNFSAVTGNFSVGTLAPGETATLTFSARVVSTQAEFFDGDGDLSVNATNDAGLVSVASNDPNEANDRGTAEIDLVTPLNISGGIYTSLVQSAGVGSASDGDTPDTAGTTETRTHAGELRETQPRLRS